MRRILLGTMLMLASINTALADAGTNEVMRSYARARMVLDADVAAMGGAEALAAVRNVTRESESYRTNPGQGTKPFAGAPSIDKYPLQRRRVESQPGSARQVCERRRHEASTEMNLQLAPARLDRRIS